MVHVVVLACVLRATTKKVVNFFEEKSEIPAGAIAPKYFPLQPALAVSLVSSVIVAIHVLISCVSSTAMSCRVTAVSMAKKYNNR